MEIKSTNHVTQTSGLLYRRLPVGRRAPRTDCSKVFKSPVPSDARQARGPRYSRLEVCATLPSAAGLLAHLEPFFEVWIVRIAGGDSFLVMKTSQSQGRGLLGSINNGQVVL